MKRFLKSVIIGMSLIALCLVAVNSVSAQCNTCATPVVAYSPVVQSTVTYEPYRGWYLGKWFDNMRMRRWGYSAPTTVTATYAPTTVGYAPYTASYAPYTASYAPYTASYAPVSYSTPYVTSYAPLGQRQVLMRPVVVGSPIISSGCSTCAAPAPCSSCSACSSCDPCSSCAGSVQPATYAAPACSSCAGGSSITYSTPSTSSQMSAPALTPQEAAPLRSNYPATSDDVTPPKDPGPAGSESSTYFEAPKLFNPQDRTAQHETAKPINRAPSVDVWTAVYSKPVTSNNISTSTAPRSQAEIDAEGWSSVPAGR